MRIDTYSETLMSELRNGRTGESSPAIRSVVQDILTHVRQSGDTALKEYTRKFDQIELTDVVSVMLSSTELSKHLAPEVMQAIKTAADSIHKFHEAQRPEHREPVMTRPGISCWQKKVPIQRVGIYVPGGSAPLFSSLLMAAIPAQIAGCKDIIVVSPPTIGGAIAPVIAWTAQLLGIHEIYAIGGAQAIGALAYGTQSIRSVDKIVGPGNAYVNEAKKLVAQERVSIDIPAGPSEVLVIADPHSPPAIVAADLLSQAEHDPASRLFLILLPGCQSDVIITQLHLQLNELPRKAIAASAVENLHIIHVNNNEEAISATNTIACEHVIVGVEHASDLAQQITTAGSVFVGPFTPESFGDYASGTNHILPTGGWARSHSGLSVESFLRTVTYQTATLEGFNDLAGTVCTLARAEGLEGHARAITIRQKEKK